MTEEDSNLNQGMIESNDSSTIDSLDCIGEESPTSSHDSDSVSKLKAILEFSMHIARLGVQVFLNIWKLKH